MIDGIDDTHDPRLVCWVPDADGHPAFPVQNLPFAIFTPPGSSKPRGGVAIGDSILDLPAVADLLGGALPIWLWPQRPSH